MATKPQKIKRSTIVLMILLYTFFTNLSDVKNGVIDGWNSIKYEKPK